MRKKEKNQIKVAIIVVETHLKVGLLQKKMKLIKKIIRKLLLQKLIKTIRI